MFPSRFDPSSPTAAVCDDIGPAADPGSHMLQVGTTEKRGQNRLLSSSAFWVGDLPWKETAAGNSRQGNCKCFFFVEFRTAVERVLMLRSRGVTQSGVGSGPLRKLPYWKEWKEIQTSVQSEGGRNFVCPPLLLRPSLLAPLSGKGVGNALCLPLLPSYP